MTNFANGQRIAEFWNAVKALVSSKQDKITGQSGQVVGFSSSGDAMAVTGWSDSVNIIERNKLEIGESRKAIPESSDLDTYTNIGAYMIGMNSSAKTLFNCPVGIAFKLDVTAIYGVERKVQILTTIYDEIWYRWIGVPDASKVWHKVVFEDEFQNLASSKQDKLSGGDGQVVGFKNGEPAAIQPEQLIDSVWPDGPYTFEIDSNGHLLVNYAGTNNEGV